MSVHIKSTIPKSLFAGALVACALVAGCSSSTESVETKDIFASSTGVAVPAFTNFQENIQETVQANVQANVQGVLQQEFVQAGNQQQQPANLEVQTESYYVPVPGQAPAQNPYAGTGYDCTVIPTGKAEIAIYRANCL